MSRFRTPIVGLMAMILIVAIGLAAIRSRSRLAYETTFTLSVVLLLAAPILAKFRRGADGAFWFGFAVFGWGAFLIGSSRSVFLQGTAPAIGFGVNVDLLPMRLAKVLASRSGRDWVEIEVGRVQTDLATKIGYLFVSLLIGSAGGVFAILARGRRSRPAASSPRPEGSTVARGRSPRGWWALLIVAGALLLTPVVGAVRDEFGSSGRFFSSGRSADTDGLESRHEARYAKHLKAMGESPLVRPARDGRSRFALRVLALPSFSPPLMLRLERTPEGGTLRAVALTGMGGYEPGEVGVDRRVSFGAGRWAELEAEVRSSGFWSTPTEKPRDENDSKFGGGMMDGTFYLYEAIDNGAYHVVERANNDLYGSKLEAIYDRLAKLADITYRGEPYKP